MANAKQMPSGKWRVQVFLGTDENGKKRKKSITAPTGWQAEKLAAEIMQDLQTTRSRFTVAQAVRGYIDSKRNVLSPSTVYGYENILQAAPSSQYKAPCVYCNSVLRICQAQSPHSASISFQSINNPVLQNQTHINVLQRALQCRRCFSVIAFNDTSELEYIDIHSQDVFVLNLFAFRDFMKDMFDNEPDALSAQEVEAVTMALRRYCADDPESNPNYKAPRGYFSARTKAEEGTSKP